MDLFLFKQNSETEWVISPFGKMRVPAILYATKSLVRAMDQKVYEQLTNVAALPGIQKASYAMPDAHWGYGFPIGGVAAFDPKQGGVVSAGGVGFDISCGVRLLRTGLSIDDLKPIQKKLADALFQKIPAGVGSTGTIRLNAQKMHDMLTRGAHWAVEQGYGTSADLERIEEQGWMKGAKPSEVSEQAKKRQRDEMGTLGSGNHYLEVQKVSEIYDSSTAEAFQLHLNDVVLSIHCGSRGLGHQIGTEFLREMVISAKSYGIDLPDRELACAPIHSEIGERYLGAMRSAMNCAFANRQILTHLTRQVFSDLIPKSDLILLYDVSHNTCKMETHEIDGVQKKIFVHRKGATRAFGPGHPDLPAVFQKVGQPVFIGGSMGTSSYVLVGTNEGMKFSFGSSCHGAGRAMSRNQALKKWKGREVIDDLAQKGILIRSPSYRGVAEEAPGAYKDVSEVVDAAEQAKLSKKVAKLLPLICVKG